MAKPRFRRGFKQKRLRAKYWCPECGRVAYYRCYLDGPGEQIRGRPKRDYCTCGMLTEYRGFVSTYVETVPYATGGRMMLRCRGCGRDTEHANLGGKFWRCLGCGIQRLADDEEEAKRQAESEARSVSGGDIWGE